MAQITVNGQQLEWEEGMTVNRVLEKMNYSWRLLVIKVNGTLIKKEAWNESKVPPGAEVSVFHLLSGG
ncbi:MAG TPA: sulfur carrier protein ThiS [Candidatus Syntrophosphaera sp.]|jgi:thiamine biosynthesis protein ThiS|nr:sulfur carrier protein ThiS [Candidatus Syntrophosphaera sp.]